MPPGRPSEEDRRCAETWKPQAIPKAVCQGIGSTGLPTGVGIKGQDGALHSYPEGGLSG